MRGQFVVIAVIGVVYGGCLAICPELKLDQRIKEEYQLKYSRQKGFIFLAAGILCLILSFLKSSPWVINLLSIFVILLFVLNALLMYRYRKPQQVEKKEKED